MGKIDISTQRVSNSLRIANSSLTLIYNHPSKALIHKIMILISIRKPNGPMLPLITLHLYGTHFLHA